MGKAKKLVVFTALTAALGTLALAGCGESSEETTQEANTSLQGINIELDEVEQEQEEEKTYEGNVDPLTGLYDLEDSEVGTRPVAVMVNNVAKALPQYGVEDADIIFEIPVEGDQTRLLAIYPSYLSVPKICSVRSYRYYFASVLCGFDAIYIHWGEDQTMMDYYNSLGMDTYDGLSNTNLFGRDADRRSAGYDLEHTGYFDGTLLPAEMEKDGVRTELASGYEGTAFNFAGPDEALYGTTECTEVDLDFGVQSTEMVYNDSEAVYDMYYNGDPHIDGNTGNQLAFKNVIVLETSISIRENQNKGRLSLDWQGGNDSVGYYVSNGSVTEITWSKASEYDQFKFYDKATGEELEMNAGKTYVCFCENGMDNFLSASADESEDAAQDTNTLTGTAE